MTLASQAPDTTVGRRVYVVGYSGKDARVDSTLMEYVMSHIYDVKRLQPGEVIEILDQAPTFSHDCFTLGGNGGSTVIDLETDWVLGLRYAGHLQPDRQTKTGEAVSGWQLADDPLLRGGGLSLD